MSRRYYCDYCDKTFIDDVEARKKHLNSTFHVKLKKMHYDMYRDPRTILQEEAQKTPCRRFLESGHCQFESSCKYTHYAPVQLKEIQRQIQHEEQMKLHKYGSTPEVPSPESWLQRYEEKKGDGRKTDGVEFWTYPEQLEGIEDLPPSLKKFKPEDFIDSDYEEWG